MDATIMLRNRLIERVHAIPHPESGATKNANANPSKARVNPKLKPVTSSLASSSIRVLPLTWLNASARTTIVADWAPALPAVPKSIGMKNANAIKLPEKLSS